MSDVRDIPHYYRCRRHRGSCTCPHADGLHESDCRANQRYNASDGLDCRLCRDERDAALDELVEAARGVWEDWLREGRFFAPEKLGAALKKFGVGS